MAAKAMAKEAKPEAKPKANARPKAQAYTVARVAALSGVSVRTLRFYHQRGLLKPAFVAAKGYRFYEEPQLLTLQQILFYRELGFELKKIKRVLGRPDFEVLAALGSHREILQADLGRTRTLLGTIDRTIEHLQGVRKMRDEEMFAGFTVPAGGDRLGQHIKLDGLPVDCKLSSADTAGAMSVFEVTFPWPRHLHRDQDEWAYVVEGEMQCEVAGRRFRVGRGESVFIPRKAAHTWGPADGAGCRVVNVYQPAGDMEQFFRAVAGAIKDLPTREQMETNTYTQDQVEAVRRLFEAHGMELVAPLPAEE